MFNIGPMEFLVIAVIALIVFGPQRLPEMARMVGKALSEFKRQAGDIRAEIETSFEVDDRPEPPARSQQSEPPARSQQSEQHSLDESSATSTESEQDPSD
jgi:Tat protein translocase TatB subunit